MTPNEKRDIIRVVCGGVMFICAFVFLTGIGLAVLKWKGIIP